MQPDHTPCTLSTTANASCIAGACIPANSNTDPCAGVTCPAQGPCDATVPTCVAGVCVARAQYDGTACALAGVATARCVSAVCTAINTANNTCYDNKKSGLETDVDCGGTGSGCFRCAAGKACKVSTDCQSRMCQSKKCQASGDVSVTVTLITFNVNASSSSSSPLCFALALALSASPHPPHCIPAPPQPRLSRRSPAQPPCPPVSLQPRSPP